jgi:hypothetical protein
MKKTIFTLPLVIPLVSLMSASAGANNHSCCCSAVPASEPPAVAPECKTVTVAPVSARCTDGPDQTNFCDGSVLPVDKVNFPITTFKYKFDATLKHCVITEIIGDQSSVSICAPTVSGVTICPVSCPINH